MIGTRLLPVLFLAGISGCGAKPAPTPITLGHLAPRSGPQRDYGLQTEQAILVAVETIRADNLVLERPVSVLHPDTHGDAEDAQRSAVRMLAVNEVAGLIGGPDFLVEERLCRTAQQDKTPLLTPVWLPAHLLGPYGFSLGPVPEDQGKALAEHAGKKLGLASVAVLLDSKNPAALALADAFTTALGKSAVTWRGDLASGVQASDLAKALAAAKPAGVLIAATPGELVRLHDELAQAGLPADIPLLFGGQDDGTLASLSERWANHPPLHWTTLFARVGGRSNVRDFIQKYQARFGRAPQEPEALAYDAVNVLAEALRRAKSVNSEKVRDELAGLKDLDGLTGTISFEKNQAVGRPVYVVPRLEESGDRKDRSKSHEGGTRTK